MDAPAGQPVNRQVRNNINFAPILLTISYYALPILFFQHLLPSHCTLMNTRLHILTTIILFFILANVIHSAIPSLLIRPARLVQENISSLNAQWLRWRCPILTVVGILVSLILVGWVVGGAREILGFLGMIWAATWC